MARGLKTGGRRKGSLNQRTLAMQEHVASALADNATPLDFLISIYRNPVLPVELRLHAAAKAAPYIHRQLKSVEQTAEGGGPQRVVVSWDMTGMLPSAD